MFYEQFISDELTPTKVRHVYHYTSINAFENIIKGMNADGSSICLRASNSDMKNDSAEYKLGVEFLRKIWQERYKDPKAEIEARLNKLSSNSVFSVSFTTQRDCLPMWYMYAQGGVALQFSLASLKNSIDDEDDFLMQCYYGEDKFEKGLISLESENSPIAEIRKSELMFYAPYFLKHKAYKHEHEIRRVVIRNNPEMDERYVADEHNQYLNLDIPKESLTGIVISPSDEKSVKERHVRDILKMYGYSNVRIWSSSIPFRWNR